MTNRVPTSFANGHTAHSYQDRACDYVVKHKQVYLAMDMGLGKTLVTLMAIKRLGTKAIVFGPKSAILSTWPNEIKKWYPELRFKVLQGPDKNLVNIDSYDILLINYEGLQWLGRNVTKWQPRMLVMDESSMLKSPSTVRFEIFKKSFPLWTDYRIALSATPAPNGLDQLWSQYYMLDRGQALEINITRFRNKYCLVKTYPGLPTILYPFNEMLADIVHEKVAHMTVRLKAEDHLNMPEVIHNNIIVELPPKARKIYNEFERDFIITINKTDVEAGSKAVLSHKLRQVTQGGVYDEDRNWHVIHDAKVQALKDFIEVSNKPVCVAVQFKGELALLRKAFPKAPVVAGGTPAAKLAGIVNKWNRKEIPVLFCHPQSLSHSVNMQEGGSCLVWFALTWSLEHYIQLFGRFYRQGQKEAVVVHHIIAKDTIDERVLGVLQNKEAVQSGFLDYLRTSYNQRLLEQ